MKVITRIKWVSRISMYNTCRVVPGTWQVSTSSAPKLCHIERTRFCFFFMAKTQMYIKYLLWSRQDHNLIKFPNISKRENLLPCFNNEAQSAHLICLSWHSKHTAKQEFKPRTLNSFHHIMWPKKKQGDQVTQLWFWAVSWFFWALIFSSTVEVWDHDWMQGHFGTLMDVGTLCVCVCP